jgi:DNA-binding CsgD family transcriptional regulator
MSIRASSEPLVGRELELAELEDRLDHLKLGGAALVIRGPAGVGKSAVLGAVRRIADDRGMKTLTTVGIQSEAHIGFAGLLQLLRPVLPDALDGLPAPQRRAIKGAFGLTDAPAPDFFLIALAALELLSDLAASAPLLLIVEDAHWLDAATSDVLAFIARRLEAEPIVALFEVRTGFAARVDHASLPVLDLDPLAETASEALLDATAPDLAPELRTRVLAEALGNPLALVELPHAVDAGFDPTANKLPLTQRLERTFAASIAGFPEGTRTLLLMASLDDDGDVDQMLAAASALNGSAVGALYLSTAIDARVIVIEDGRIRFRHPLMRSAIQGAADASTRRTAHIALADAYRGDPDRNVWHRAAALDVPDDGVAAELEAAAERAVRRGASAIAATALERGAQLATDDVRRGRLLVRAASIEQELGRIDVSTGLAERAARLEIAPEDQTVLAFLLEQFERGTWSGATRIDTLVDLAEQQAADGHVERAMDTLLAVSSRCWWGVPTQETRDRVVAVAEGLPGPADGARLLFVLAHADPVRSGAVVRDRISGRGRSDVTDPAASFLVGAAANAVWSFDLALGFLDAATSGLRAQGRLGLLAEALVAQAWAAVHQAREPLAVSAAEEAIRLSQEMGQRRRVVAAQLAKATIAAERGDVEAMEPLAIDAEREIIGMGASPMLALALFVRGRRAVAHQEYVDGLGHLRRTLDPSDVAYHPFVGAWCLSDLVEATAHTGQEREAGEYLEQLESLAAATNGSLLVAEVGYARPMVAGDEDAEALYRTAIDRDLADWPCYRGRMLLWYGRWLRRQRRAVESRAPLRQASEGFEALAFPALAETAHQELRASGATSGRRATQAWEQLTPQELQIARLAAEGLTNREIGEKLFLSHRTIESHLYRIFPKLGVTTRNQVRDALARSVVERGGRSAPALGRL